MGKFSGSVEREGQYTHLVAGARFSTHVVIKVGRLMAQSKCPRTLLLLLLLCLSSETKRQVALWVLLLTLGLLMRSLI